MKNKQLYFISMFIFMTVFTLAAIFDIQTPSHKSQNKATVSDKVVSTTGSTSEKSQNMKIQSFSNDSNNQQVTTAAAEKITSLPTTSPSPTPSPTPIATPTPKPKYSDIGISIAKDYVNIRKKASTTSETLGKLYRNSAAKILKTKDDWYYIESGSVKGYVKCELLKTGLSDRILINKYGTPIARVNVDGLNVREKAAMDSKKITTIYNDETYPVLSAKGDWVKIDLPDEKSNGYVKKEYVELEAVFKDAVSKQEEDKLKQIEAEKRLKKQTEIKHGAGINYTNNDLQLLTCLIQAEAGHQSYECKLAVANVVLNRVKLSHSSFESIVYSPGQFSVAQSGSLEKQINRFSQFDSQAELLSIKAAKDALNGTNNIGTRRYFHSYSAAVKKGYDKKSNAVKLGGLVFW